MVPEVDALLGTSPFGSSGSLIRIPDSQDVPITPRVRRLLDTPPMRRLASISQLGMVSLVYPGATHSRFEHSLGVYHNALRLLARFRLSEEFRDKVQPADAEAFVLASLLHDIGHWPFCHPIEDMQLSGIAEHEARVEGWLETEALRHCLERDWACSAFDVTQLLHGDLSESGCPARQLLASCLSGPIDVDKLDYLRRDSLHAGVPYGRNFDAGRLINSMCVHPAAPRVAVSEKGRTAAEMMVFSRYVMFSEVYWHHAVRSATAMLQRAVFHLRDQIDLQASLRLTDAEWVSTLVRAAAKGDAEPLADGLFGPRRMLFKRLAEYSVMDGHAIHQKLARRPYWWLVACAEELAQQLSRKHRLLIRPTDLLIDAPPVKLEVDINIDVVGRGGEVRPLGDVSPVASALANRQFDDQVKRVRVYVLPDVRAKLGSALSANSELTETLAAAIETVEKEVV